MQAIGDGGQGWGNAILYIFASKIVRKRLFGWMWRALLWCWRRDQGINTAVTTQSHTRQPRLRSKRLGVHGSAGVAVGDWLQGRHVQTEPISFDSISRESVVFESPGRVHCTPPKRNHKRNATGSEYECTTTLSSYQPQLQ